MTQTLVDGALERLTRRLPLAARQSALPLELAAVHRSILRSLHAAGRPPEPAAIAAHLSEFTPAAAIARLAADDLIVLSPNGSIAGAYPMTTAPTPHLVAVAGRTVHAMCAVDPLSIAPMFGGEVEIRSSCRVTGDPVAIRQRGLAILSAEPATVLAGVRWADAKSGHAAHSLCLEMVFLRDEDAARAWHKGDLAAHTVLPLPDAVEFGARFFCPLL